MAILRRKFEYVAGTSNKFWEIQVDNKTVFIGWGRRGTKGQSTTKIFSSNTSADTYVARVISEKIGRGYVEVTADKPIRIMPSEPLTGEAAKAKEAMDNFFQQAGRRTPKPKTASPAAEVPSSQIKPKRKVII